MIFAKPRLMKWNNLSVTDHNRSALSKSIEEIGTTHRTKNGTMRKFIIARKATFSCSWENVPHTSRWTVDNFAGANEMEEFYKSNTGPFTLELTTVAGVEYYQVMMTEFSKEISKRGAYDMYQVSVSLEEV